MTTLADTARAVAHRLDLASTVALRISPFDGTCPAWIESAERRCGKRATKGYLCSRHHKVAVKRLEQRQAKDAAQRERAEAKRAARRPKVQAELDRVNARMKQLSPDSGPLDHGVLNTPLRRRALTDSQISEMAALVDRRARLMQEL